VSEPAGMPPLWLLQSGVAAVWLYEGLWCKVLGRSKHEFEVVAQVPFLAPATSHALLRVLGLVETVLAVWSRSPRLSRRPRCWSGSTPPASTSRGIKFPIRPACW